MKHKKLEKLGNIFLFNEFMHEILASKDPTNNNMWCLFSSSFFAVSKLLFKKFLNSTFVTFHFPLHLSYILLFLTLGSTLNMCHVVYFLLCDMNKEHTCFFSSFITPHTWYGNCIDTPKRLPQGTSPSPWPNKNLSLKEKIVYTLKCHNCPIQDVKNITNTNENLRRYQIRNTDFFPPKHTDTAYNIIFGAISVYLKDYGLTRGA